MPIYADQNLYNGVNPHLNSYLQNSPGRWESFRSRHIHFLEEALNIQLPPGYTTEPEESLQISQITVPLGQPKKTWTKGDIVIFGEPTGTAVALAPMTPFAVRRLIEVDDAVEYLTSLMIYQLNTANLPGTPVTRIEVLSPANKPGGSHHEQYRQKRRETLYSGLNLVEIDYLHQAPPVLPEVPSYANRDERAFPFLMFVSDPRPAYEAGHIQFYGSYVDMPLPQIRLPLAGADEITFDLNPAYNRTYEFPRTYAQVVDYAALPLAFERYSADDQVRIRARMAAIAEAQK